MGEQKVFDDNVIKRVRNTENIEFYQYLYKKEGIDINNIVDEKSFKKLPIINKEGLNKLAESIKNSRTIKERRLDIQRVRTSGSTGKFTEIYWIRDEYQKANIEIWRLRSRWYGIKPSSKCVSFSSMIFLGNRIGNAERIKYFGNSLLSFSKYWLEDEDFVMYGQEMEKYRPEWMLLQPSTCLRMIEAFEKYNIKLCDSVRYIELNGEAVTRDVEEYIREKTKVIVANMYGANEVGAIAYECPEHELHILEDNVYFETINEEDKTEILVTSKKNSLMPVIRYNLQDVIKVKRNFHCSCGCSSEVIDSISGRACETITINGRILSPHVFLYVVESVNDTLNHPILQYQLIVEEGRRKITLCIVVKPEFASWKNTIKNELQNKARDCINDKWFSIEIEFVDNVITDGNNKFKMFVFKDGNTDE